MGTVFIAIDKCDQENGCLKVRRTVTCCLLCGLLCGSSPGARPSHAEEGLVPRLVWEVLVASPSTHESESKAI